MINRLRHSIKSDSINRKGFKLTLNGETYQINGEFQGTKLVEINICDEYGFHLETIDPKSPESVDLELWNEISKRFLD